MTPDLDRRLAVLGRKYVDSDERIRIADAVADADGWDSLDADVRALIEDIEQRPDTIFAAAPDGAAGEPAAFMAPLLDHPGHPDQKSHGRAKGGVRRSLAQAQTTEEISAVLSSEASRIVGDEFHANLAGADPQVAREFSEGVLRGLEKYPAAPLREVGTYGPGGSGTELAAAGDRTSKHALAITARGGETDGAGGTIQTRSARMPNGTTGTGTAIYLNVKYDVTYWNQIRNRTKAFSGRDDMVGTSPRAVALHEFGHAIGRHGRPSEPEYAVGQKARELAKAAGKTPKEFVAKGVSQYATTNNAELTAEAFSDVMENGSRARALSKTLTAVLDENYQGWERAVS